MRFISFAILVSGILLIRKLMWKRISRKTQYALWIFPALFLLLNPFWNISSKWSIENILFTFEQRTLQETEKYFPDIWNQSDNFRENSDNHIYSKKNIKERLIMIKTKRKCSKVVSIICIMCIVILTGCTFAQKPVGEEEIGEKEEVVINEIVCRRNTYLKRRSFLLNLQITLKWKGNRENIHL